MCIGTWPYTHCEMTLAALDAGKHVLCEARMAMNAAEGRRMLEASRRAPAPGEPSSCPRPTRSRSTRPSSRSSPRATLGEVLAVELQAGQGSFVEPDAPLHWRQDIALSGHNILNMGIWYEAMIALARPRPAGDGDDEDRGAAPPRRRRRRARRCACPTTSTSSPRFGGGAVAHLRFSAVTALAPAPEAWIFGSEGTLRLEADARASPAGGAATRRSPRSPSPPSGASAGASRRSSSTPSAAREKITRTTFEDGVRYMEFTDAVTKSAASGQAVEVAEL